MIPILNNKLLYTDQFSVSRLQKELMPDKSSHQTLLPVEDMQNLPCRVSRVAGDAAQTDGDTVNMVKVELMMFTHLAYTVMPGDTVDVTRRGNSQRYIAGEPFLYDHHQEIALSREGEA